MKLNLLKQTPAELEKRLLKEGPKFIGEVLVELDDLLEHIPADVYQNPRVLNARKVIEDLFNYSLEHQDSGEARQLRLQYCKTYFGVLVNHGLPPVTINTQKSKPRHYWSKGLQYDDN